MKTIWKVLICFALLLALLLGGMFWFQSEYLEIESEYLKKDITELTLTQKPLPEAEVLQELTCLRELDVRRTQLSIDEYEQLKAVLPDCEIQWLVPFQGQYLPEDTAELTVSSLTSDDFRSFEYLPKLKTIHADGCRDYDALLALRAARPDLDIHYTVAINGEEFADDTAELTLSDANIDEVAVAIPYLPQLRQIVFTGTAPQNDAIYQLMCDYPHISFHWNLTLFGIETPNTATELILSGIPMEDSSEVEGYLKYFPNLERVEMCDCGIPSAEMDALSQRWPDIRFVWTVKIGLGKLRTDTTAFMPLHLGYAMTSPLYDEDCTELKYCTDMVCLDLGHMRIKDLSFLAYMPKLKYLIVADIPCKDYSALANLKELIYLEIFMVKFPNQEVLLELTNLQDLNISLTAIEDVEVFKQMSWLKRLWASGSGITTPQLDALRIALPNTQIKTNLPHSTAGGWRDHQNYRDMRDLLGMFYMD